jgi:hypothetical protein
VTPHDGDALVDTLDETATLILHRSITAEAESERNVRNHVEYHVECAKNIKGGSVQQT